MSARSEKSLTAITLIVLALIWGSSFILMKKAMKGPAGEPILSSYQVAALRLTLAGTLLLPFSWRALRRIRKDQWKWLAVVGLLGSGVPAFLFTTSQRFLDSGLAGILNSLTPLWTLIVGMLIFRRPAAPRQVTGVLIGLGGAVSLISLKGMGASENTGWGWLIVLATLSYGLSVNTVQNKLRDLRSLDITSVSLLLAGIPCSIYLATSDLVPVLRENPLGWKGFGFVLILAVVGTAGANMLYFWLTQKRNALFASSVTYLMPLVSLAWGAFDNEKLHTGHFLCMAIILAGVWLVSSSGKAAPGAKTS